MILKRGTNGQELGQMIGFVECFKEGERDREVESLERKFKYLVN